MKPLLSIKQASELTGLSVPTLYKYVFLRTIPFVKLFDPRTVRRRSSRGLGERASARTGERIGKSAMEGKLHHKLGVFGAVPLMLLRERTVTGTELRVYIALSSFEGVKAESYPAVRTIADGQAFQKAVFLSQRPLSDARAGSKLRDVGKDKAMFMSVYPSVTRRAKLTQIWFAHGKRTEAASFRKPTPREFKDSAGSDNQKTGPVGNKKTTPKDHRERVPPQFPPKGTCLTFQRVHREARQAPLSLLTRMKEVAKEKGIQLSFPSILAKSMKDAAFGRRRSHTIPLVTFAQSIQELQNEGRAFRRQYSPRLGPLSRRHSWKGRLLCGGLLEVLSATS